MMMMMIIIIIIIMRRQKCVWSSKIHAFSSTPDRSAAATKQSNHAKKRYTEECRISLVTILLNGSNASRFESDQFLILPWSTSR
jgi:hypothetical protein